jgi:hypothetical protein
MTFCASAWLLQKDGSAIDFSISASWASSGAASKMPPKLEGAAVEVVVLAYQFVVEGHGISC